MKNERDEESQAFLDEDLQDKTILTPTHEKQSSRSQWWRYIRIAIEVTMACAIIYLLFFRAPPSRNLRRSPVPEFPRKIYTFHEDPQYTREDMFLNESLTLRTLHNWIPLSSDSRGYVRAPENLAAYDLPEPHEIAIDRHNDGPGYMMSVFHQLHCLSYLAEHFQRGYGGKELTKEIAHHSAHCFSYLRQGITCNADVTLEGKTDLGPGEGSEHECVDYDKLLEWANEHSAYKWRNALLPPDSIL